MGSAEVLWEFLSPPAARPWFKHCAVAPLCHGPGVARMSRLVRGPAQSRKRKACADLRTLAREADVALPLAASHRRSGHELPRHVFHTCVEHILTHAQSEEVRASAQALRSEYAGAVAEGGGASSADVGSSQGSEGHDPGAPSHGEAEAMSEPGPASQGSAPAAPTPPVAARVPSSARGFRLRGRACLFTYNSPSFVLSSLEPLWESFLQFLQALTLLCQWTATVEKSLRSTLTDRLHFHVFAEFKKAVDWTSLAPMKWEGVLPNAAPAVARGSFQRAVVDRGHFYVWANKVGTEKVATSGWEPWLDYRVRGVWLDDLWAHHKITHDVYEDYACKARVGFCGRQRQVETIREREKKADMEKKQAEVAKKLAPLQKPFKPEVLALLEPWQSQYKQDLPRYKFLVLFGGSRAGKSSLAKSLGRAFVQTVQNAGAPDLRGHDAAQHDLIVFDNINDQQFVLDQRALFQANNDVHTLGESRTGIYAYHVWLWRVPMVLTVDTSAVWDSQEPWLAANSFEVRLAGPCWAEEA